MEEIIGTFIISRDMRHPLSGEPISKTRRMNEMYEIVTNSVYNKEYNKDERILAAELIKKILQED